MKLYAENFLSLESLELDFNTWPQLVLLLGDNGAGKTAIFDLYLWILTGQTSRRATHDSVISYKKEFVLGRLEEGDYTIIRSRKHPDFGTDLDVLVNGVSVKKSSIQETQKFIDATLLSYQEIISTSYLSQHSLIFDLTDSDRKGIISCLLKLEAIQKAREGVGKEKREKEAELSQIDALFDKMALEVKSDDYSEKIQEIKRKIAELDDELWKLEPKYVEYESCLKKISKLEKIDVCPTCLRPLSESEKKDILHKEYKMVEKLRPAIEKIETITMEKNTLRTRLMDLVRLEGAASKQRELVQKMDSFRARADELTQQINDLKILEQAFSQKGAITLILEQFSDVLNERLGYFTSLMFPEVSLELIPYKTLKSGETRPAIDIEIKKGKSKIDYYNLSSGEKKRVNLVLLFTLSELFNRSGVLFCDETFDHLDIEGIEGIVEALSSLNIPHVVVTSHSQAVSSYFSNVVEVEKKEGITRMRMR